MSGRKCSPDEFADALLSSLSMYTDEVTEGVKAAVDVVAKEVNAEIKSHVTFKGSGKYVKSFRLKTSFENKQDKRVTWYVKEPDYRLTHLLENGHALPNGKRTKAFPHIKYGEELANKRLEELAKEAIVNAGR